MPSDRLGHAVAKLLIEPSATRDRLTAGMYLPRSEADIIGKLEAALEATIAAEPIERKLRDAQKAGTIAGEDLARAGARRAGSSGPTSTRRSSAPHGCATR